MKDIMEGAKVVNITFSEDNLWAEENLRVSDIINDILLDALGEKPVVIFGEFEFMKSIPHGATVEDIKVLLEKPLRKGKGKYKVFSKATIYDMFCEGGILGEDYHAEVEKPCMLDMAIMANSAIHLSRDYCHVYLETIGIHGKNIEFWFGS